MAKKTGTWHVVKAAELISFVGQDPMNGGSKAEWVGTYQSEKEARGVASLESIGSGVEHWAVKADSYTGRISLLRRDGKLVAKDWSLNA